MFIADYLLITPTPVAQSVNTWDRGGMEYPMITFNGYRPDPPKLEKDKPATTKANEQRAYSRDIKYSLIGVIIHEIGHIYFPMVVNSDERQWTWDGRRSQHLPRVRS